MKNPHILTGLGAAALIGTLWAAAGPLSAQNEDSAAPAQPAKTAPEPDETRPAGQSDNQFARSILDRSRQALVNKQSIQAEIVEAVALGGRTLHATGSYLQGQNLKLRLELTVRLGDGPDAVLGSLLQVCDGQVLWTQHTIADQPRVTRRDVRQILQAAESTGRSPHNELVADLGLGGLPALLASLQRVMTFDSVERIEIGGQPVTVVEGLWRDEYTRQWEAAATHQETAELPAHIPDRVRIYFDKDYLPRRILYLKKISKEGALQPMVTLDFKSIKLNAPIDEKAFRYSKPETTFVDDVTPHYIQRLRQPGAPQETHAADQ